MGNEVFWWKENFNFEIHVLSSKSVRTSSGRQLDTLNSFRAKRGCQLMHASFRCHPECCRAWQIASGATDQPGLPVAQPGLRVGNWARCPKHCLGIPVEPVMAKDWKP